MLNLFWNSKVKEYHTKEIGPNCVPVCTLTYSNNNIEITSCLFSAGYSPSPRLPESAGPHREVDHVGINELREINWNQANRIACNGSCCFSVCSVLCSSQSCLLLSGKNLRRSGKRMVCSY